jgi:DNA-binding CsgD family transcriptional regulator/tetratricopeptide (TPR) repeat protein
MAAWPLTGRAEEMAAISTALRPGGDYCGVIIAGGAGVGKTRLSAEVCEAARTDGWIVHSIVGTLAAQSIPLGVFSQWIDGTDGQLLNLVAAVMTALTAAPNGEPILIAVDNAELLDDQSAFVIHQLVRRRAVQVIMTVRTGQSAAETVRPLWKDGLLLRLDLQPLSRHQCDALLQLALGGEVGTQTAQRMWDLTRGNVLFLYQLVLQELQAGRLRATGATWRWSGEMKASPTLIDLIDSYVGTAPEEILDVLDLVAVAEPLELALVSELVDPAKIEVADQAGFIAVDVNWSAAVLRFSHPLYGEVRRARMGPLRAARLRGVVAGAMRDRAIDSAQVDWLRLALLWLESDLPGDIGLLHRGAAEAFLRLDLGLTNRLCVGALAAGAGPEVRLLYALSLYSMGCGLEAEAILDAMPSATVHDFIWVTTAMIRAANRHFLLGQPDDSWTVLEEALNAAPAELAAQLMPLRVAQLAMAARPAEAAGLAASLDKEMLGALSRTVLACGEVIALGDLGQPDEATDAVNSCNRSAADAPEAAYQTVALNLLHADALILSGHLRQAESLGERLYERWADVPQDPSAVAVAIKGIAALAQGDLLLAQQQLEAAIVECEPRHGRTGGMYLFWLAYTEALARAGKVDAAVEALDEVSKYRHPSYVYVESGRLLVIGWVAAARGLVSEAVDLAREAAAFASSHRQYAREVAALQAAIQFGDTDSASRLAELSTFVNGPRAQLAARWASAVVNSDGTELLRVSEELESMGDRIAAADAAAHAARAFEAANLHQYRLRAFGRAAGLMAACGGMTPATRAGVGTLPLSEREREIAAMVGEGFPNKHIAEVLFMSVRTVEGHIYRACTKLGLKNRAELASALEQFSVLSAAFD